MNASQYARVQALRHALDAEVHGLWISDEMAVKVLAHLDKVTSAALKLLPEKTIAIPTPCLDPAGSST